MSAALRAGFRSVARNRGLVVLVLLANLALALVLAVPLSMQLEGDLANRGAASGMMYGFDYDWWAEWSERQAGPSSALSPDILRDRLLSGVPGSSPATRRSSGWVPSTCCSRSS